MKRWRGLFGKYVAVFVVVISGALLVSGALDVYFASREIPAALVVFQREKAYAAAGRIEAFVKEIEHQMGWTTQPQLVAPSGALEQRRVDFLRLMRQVPAITELSHLDPQGREQLRVSRLAMDVVGSGQDFSQDPRFVEARKGRTWFGPVYFRKESEPYMTIAMSQSGGGVTVAEVNLKFIWDVVSQIKVGQTGKAFVVDDRGALLAHPDISLVLQKTMLNDLEQVRAAFAATGGEPGRQVTIARGLEGRRVLTAYSMIPTLRWAVFVEQPLAEAFAPLYAVLQRTIILLALGVALSIVASLFLARRMVRPIHALQEGAARIGAGDLSQRLDIKSGDELEALAGEFNQMTRRLQESYATLEQRVVERTRELTEALEQQTATGEILRVISSSPTDVQPVFDTIVASAARLCDAAFASVYRTDGSTVTLAAMVGGSVEQESALRALFPRPVDDSHIMGSVVRRRSVIHIEDIGVDRRLPELQRVLRYRTLLAVPMLRDNVPIGALGLWRSEARPFAPGQIELLKTFADQAVIAIENVRLFSELQERNRQVTEALEQQTATAEILRVMSSSPTDDQPVLDAVAENAARLCAASNALIWRVEGDRLRLATTYVTAHDAITTPFHVGDTMPLARRSATARAVIERRLVHVEDIQAASDEEFGDTKVRASNMGWRTALAMPLMREGEPVGVIFVRRADVAPFSDDQIELLRTFADQAAIAIENVRLFREIQDKTRELEIANQHKSEFLANMSHELRTPLNAIIGFSEVMLERMFGEINGKQEEYLNDILSSGRHLLSLINDILDLSKIEAGRMELDLAEFDLPEAIQNAMILIRERAARRFITLETSVDERLGQVRADERKVKQVLLNLLSNAVKFTPEGGRVAVRAALADGLAEITVEDTGVGIAAEDQEAVFEEFRQVGTDYARKHEGTGLGLALARRFVELHGGRIWVKSDVGRGSTFTFTLPVR